MFNRTISLILLLAICPLPVKAEQTEQMFYPQGTNIDTLTEMTRELSRNLGQPDLALLLDKLASLEKEYLFETQDGSIQFDLQNDPLLRSTDPYEIKRDKSAFENEVRTLQNQILYKWESEANEIKQQILQRDNTRDKEKLERSISAEIRKYRDLINFETDKLICYSLDRFSCLREKDNYSLKQKSDNTSASSLAESYMNQMKDELEAAQAALKKDLPDSRIVQTEYASLDSEDWEKSFDRELENGLALWEKAEKEFITQRIQWELNLEKQYKETEEAWDEAFGELSQARKRWIQEMQQLFQQGLLQWEIREEESYDNFLTLSDELETAAIEQEEIFLKKVCEAIGVFRESLSYLKSAEKNIQYYDEKIQELNLQITECSNLIGNMEERISHMPSFLQVLFENLLQEEKNLRDSLVSEKGTFQQEQNSWINIKTGFETQMIQSEQLLITLQAEASGYDPAVSYISIDQETERMRNIADSLLRQVEISEKVLEYASMDSSQRPTDAETQLQHSAALQELENSEQQYRDSLEELQRLGDEISLWQNSMETDEALFQEIMDNMDKARESYDLALELFRNQDTSLLDSAISQLNAQLDQWYHGTESEPPGREELYFSYIHAGQNDWIQQREQAAQSLLRDLKGEETLTDSDDFQDFTELTQKAEALELLDPTLAQNLQEWQAQLDGAGLSTGDSAYTVLSDLFGTAVQNSLDLDSAIHDLIRDNRFNLLVNTKLQNYLTSQAPAEETLEVLNRAQQAAQNSLLLEKSEILETILQELVSGPPYPSSYKDFILSLSGAGFAPDAASLDALGSLRELLNKRVTGVLDQETFLEEIQKVPYSVQWYSLLNGEDSPGLPDLSYLDLFVQEKENDLLAAQAELYVYRFSRHLLILPDAVLDPRGIPLSTRLKDLTSMTEIQDLYQDFYKDSFLPPFILSLTEKYLHAYFAELWTNPDTEDYIDDFQDTEYGNFLTKLKDYHSGSEDMTYEADFMLSRIQEAESLIDGTTAVQDQEESFHDYADRIISMASIMENSRNEAEQLSMEKEILSLSLSEYKTSVIDIRFEEYRTWNEKFIRKSGNLNESRTRYQNLLKDYLDQKQIMNDSYARYRESRLNLQLATEILDYAACPYESASMGIDRIYEQRRNDLEKAEKALTLLEEIQSRNKTYLAPDTEWQKKIEELCLTLETRNLLETVNETMSGDLDDLIQLRDNGLKNLSDILTSAFVENSGMNAIISLGKELPDGNITDCTRYDNSQLDQYFQQSDMEERFTRDAFLWLSEIQNKGAQKLLTIFTFAYYHEFGGEVNLFSNPQHQNLLDTRGNYFNKANIGYEADMSLYQAGGYTDDQISRVLHDMNGNTTRVFITPETWLKENTRTFRDKIRSNAEINNLYCFFKILMNKGLLMDEMEKSMSMELSNLAWSYLDGIAREEQDDERNLFGNLNNLGKSIKSKRDTINAIKDNGGFDGTSKRQMLLNLSIQHIDETNRIQGYLNQMKSLMNKGTVSFQSLIQDISQISGSDPDQGKTQIIQEIFQSHTGTFSDNSDALETLAAYLKEGEKQKLKEISLLEKDLNGNRTLIREQMEEAFQNGDLDEYAKSASLLFENPSFLPVQSRIFQEKCLLSANSYSPEGQQNILETYALTLGSLFRERLEAVKNQKYDEWHRELSYLLKQKEEWRIRVQEQIQEGMTEWKNTTERMITRREGWRQKFLKEYRYKEDLWQLRYSQFNRDKEDWITDCSLQAMQNGVNSIKPDSDTEAQRLINHTRFFLIPEITGSTLSVSSILSDAMDGNTLERIIDSVTSQSQRIPTGNAIFSAVIPDLDFSSKKNETILSEQRRLKDEFKKGLSLIQAIQMTQVMDETSEMVEKTIREANESVDHSIEDTLVENGYYRRGKGFFRQVIIDSSYYGGNEIETQSIDEYRYYTAPGFDHGVDLSLQSLEHLSGTLIQARIERARENLMHYLNLIFGNEEVSQSSPADLDASFLEHIEEMQTAFESSAQYNTAYEDQEGNWHDQGKHTDIQGLFNFYLGYAPEMDKDDPETVETEGYGEMGRIFGDFQIHQARMYRGFSLVDMPGYNKKLWDDDADNDGESDSLLGAPSMRSLTDIAMNVAISAVLGPGVGNLILSTALNLLDDALFTALDVDSGYQQGHDAWSNLGKKTAVTALTTTTGSLAGNLDAYTVMTDSLGSSTAEVITDISTAAALTGVNSYGTAAINSIESDWSFNEKNFFEMTSWENTESSFLSSMAAAGMGSYIDISSFGFINTMKENADDLSGLMQGLTSTGVEYAMTGATTLNVFNMGIFGMEGKNGLVNTGLLEMNLGSDESLFTLGTGGTDVSLGTLNSALQGMEIFQRNREINQIDLGRKESIAMRTLISAEMDETEAFYNDILNRNISFTYIKDKGYTGKTVMNEDETKSIELDLNNLSALDLSILLTHEAFRDGIVSEKEQQELETIDAVTSHMEISNILMHTYGASNLNVDNTKEADIYEYYKQGQIDGKSLAEYALGNYNSREDFWMLTNDGQIVWDGKQGLYDEDGNLIEVAMDEKGNHIGFSQSLLEYMGEKSAISFLHDRGIETSGMSKAELAYALMTSSGAEWDGSMYIPSSVPGGQGYNSVTLEERLTFPASDDVLEQVALRDSIISDLGTYQAALLAGLPATELGKMYNQLVLKMGEYNAQYALEGIGMAPEGRITQQFKENQYRMEVMKDGETQYLTYTHPGIDITNSEGIYSPGFSIPGPDKHKYAIGLGIIGTTANYLYEHMNPSDVADAIERQLFLPGERIMDFPVQNYPADGGGSGTHGHFEVSLYDQNNGWGFGDPTSYMNNYNWNDPSIFSGYYEKIRHNSQGNEYWFKNINLSWYEWEPWYNQY